MGDNTASRPNILLVFPDQWRGDCLGCAGHPVVETPFLDELASGGVRFTHAYTPSPSCIAARACLVTGRTPYAAGRVGYRDFLHWNYRHTFMELLRNSGYQTLCAGKTHFYPPRARLGFEELSLYEMPWQDPDRPSDYHQWLARETNGLIRDTAVDFNSNSWVPHPWTHGEHLHPNSWTVTAAIEQLERRDTTRPFFQQVSFHRPHPPIDPPIDVFNRFLNKALPDVPVGEWAAKYGGQVTSTTAGTGALPRDLLDRTRRAYYAQIAHLDGQIGRLVRYLKGRALYNDTWIVFASDHGELLGDHNMFRKSNPLEGSACVPLVVKPADRSHGHGSRNAVRTEPVTLSDLMPTILELAGLEIPADVSGRSLVPLLQGEEVRDWPEFIHGEHSPCWQFLTDGKEKYVWKTDTAEEWLFDLENDPRELVNLSDRPGQAERVAKWRKRLVRVLEGEPELGLVRNGDLAAGVTFPATRKFVDDEEQDY